MLDFHPETPSPEQSPSTEEGVNSASLGDKFDLAIVRAHLLDLGPYLTQHERCAARCYAESAGVVSDILRSAWYRPIAPDTPSVLAATGLTIFPTDFGPPGSLLPMVLKRLADKELAPAGSATKWENALSRIRDHNDQRREISERAEDLAGVGLGFSFSSSEQQDYYERRAVRELLPTPKDYWHFRKIGAEGALRLLDVAQSLGKYVDDDGDTSLQLRPMLQRAAVVAPIIEVLLDHRSGFFEYLLGQRRKLIYELRA